MKVAGTRSSDLVAVFGVGGLGHLAIQYAQIAGGRVIAVDLVDEKLESPAGSAPSSPSTRRRKIPSQRSRSSAAPIRPSRSRSAEVVRAGLQVASARRHARVRRTSGGQRATIPIFETVLNGITIVGSIVGTRTDLREVFELHAAGKTTVTREVRPLEQVNESIADVEAGHVAARIVFGL